jgi:hypothetical protein
MWICSSRSTEDGSEQQIVRAWHACACLPAAVWFNGILLISCRFDSGRKEEEDEG